MSTVIDFGVTDPCVSLSLTHSPYKNTEISKQLYNSKYFVRKSQAFFTLLDVVGDIKETKETVPS